MLIEKHESVVRVLPRFVEAIGRHRHYERATDPPPL
jgi:hypothetical protein